MIKATRHVRQKLVVNGKTVVDEEHTTTDENEGAELERTVREALAAADMGDLSAMLHGLGDLAAQARGGRRR